MSMKAWCRQALRNGRSAPRKRGVDWTDERVALLTRCWAQGASARSIAEELGSGVSRSAVLGKIHRLKLSPAKLRQSRDAWGRGPVGAGKSGLVAAFDALGLGLFHGVLDESGAPADARKVFGTGCGLLDLSAATCRWPVGDPQHADFAFCGAAPCKPRPYCAAHCLIAYRPARPARDPRSRRRARA